MKTVIYPGSFDPITNGHLDIIERSSKIFDKIIVAVTKDIRKQNNLFTCDQRQRLIKSSVSHLDNVDVKVFDGLLVNFVNNQKSKIVIRGLRVLSDFEYEFRMALMNRKLDDDITTLFMMPNEKYTHISSTLIKEVALLGGSIKDYVPESILNDVMKKINDK
tara:strand:+ start:1604 stop:2089 length:486 start_codon:yes stop_codon:yes gene_type:complete